MYHACQKYFLFFNIRTCLLIEINISCLHDIGLLTWFMNQNKMLVILAKQRHLLRSCRTLLKQDFNRLMFADINVNTSSDHNTMHICVCFQCHGQCHPIFELCSYALTRRKMYNSKRTFKTDSGSKKVLFWAGSRDNNLEAATIHAWFSTMCWKK